MSAVPEDIAEMAALDFEPVAEPAEMVTLEEWLDRARKEYIVTVFASKLYRQTPDELAQLVGKEFDAFFGMLESLTSCRERCEHGVQYFGGIEARILGAMARHVERAEGGDAA